MLELTYIKILTTEDGYSAYRDYIKAATLEPNLGKLVRVIDKLYRNGATQIQLEDLQVMVRSEYPSMKQDNLNLVDGLITNIFNTNLDGVVRGEVVKNYRDKQVGGLLWQLGTDYVEYPEKFDISKLKKIVTDYEMTEDGNTVEFDEYTTEELAEAESDANGLSWPWKKWDECVGKLKGGGLTLIFAYPNMGKSALCHSISTHFATQTKVLVINNEERRRKAIARARSCWCEMSFSEMFMDKAKTDKRWAVIKDNWTFKQDVSLTVPNLKRYMKASGAKVVLIDQAVKIQVNKTERRDADMGEIFKQLRMEIQDEFEDVDIIGIGRGDIASKTAQKITMDMLADCKSEVQGEVDSMIGMNRQDDGDYMNIFFCKTKDTGAEGSTCTLQLIREHSRVIET